MPLGSGCRTMTWSRSRLALRAWRLPVVIQPGQAPGVASLSLGYGRRTGNVAAGVGVNAYPLMDVSSDFPAPAIAA